MMSQKSSREQDIGYDIVFGLTKLEHLNVFFKLGKHLLGALVTYKPSH